MPPSVSMYVFIIAAISLVIGGIAGLLIGSMQKDKAPKDRLSELSGQEGNAKHAFLQLSPGGNQGSVQIELRGRALTDPQSLSLDDRRVIVDLLRDTIKTLGIPNETFAPAPLPAGGPTAGGPVAAGPGAAAQQTIIGGMTNVLADAMSTRPAANAAAPSTKSIVQEIDEILQSRLTIANYTGEPVYIAEDPKKGVVVWVGNTMYEGIGGMPEGPMKRLLQSCVQEWEKRQEMTQRK